MFKVNLKGFILFFNFYYKFISCNIQFRTILICQYPLGNSKSLNSWHIKL